MPLPRLLPRRRPRRRSRRRPSWAERPEPAIAWLRADPVFTTLVAGSEAQGR